MSKRAAIAIGSNIEGDLPWEFARWRGTEFERSRA